MNPPFNAPLDISGVREARLKYGANSLSRLKPRGFFSRLLENLGDPVIKILLIALAANVIVLFREADWFETAGIIAAILVATVISALSEMGSDAAFRRLRDEAAKVKCRVIRREGTLEIPVEDVCVGDSVILQAGGVIPADGVLTEGAVDVDQSVLNGETKEARKTADTPPPRREGDLTHPRALFSGTCVRGGEGVMAVTAVGDKTFIGGVARGVQEEKGDSPLKKRLTAFAAAIANAGYIGAALVAAAYLFNAVVMDNDYNPARIALFLQSPANVIRLLTHSASLAVGVIVMAVPEGLPMMITVVLSANTRRMRKDNVLVRKLVGLETAGSMNILFTDKTGTLTVGRPKVARVISGIGDIINLSRKSALREYLRAALFFNNGASVSSGKPAGGNGTDRALLEFALKLPPSAENIRAKSKTPFDSRLKYRAAVVEGGINGAFITGAPEKILPLCGDCFTETEARAGVNRARLEAALSAAQDEAARLVAVAYSAEPVLRPGPSARFTLIAVCAVRDEARKEAPQGVNLLKRAGIQVVMITGDSKQTAAAIAKQTGIYRGGDELILTSGDMGGLNDDQLTAVLPRLRVVARALPSDKTRLVRIARNAGLVAGMTGDGVNDAPSLRKADVGFAMGSGADVAKEAADIVIMDDNLLSITKAVQYGRTIFKSIRKFIIFQMTINICAMAVSVIAPLLRVDAPVTILQMLWMNMVMDTLAGLAFAGEQTLRRYMSEKPKQLSEPILNRYMKLEIALGAAFMLALCLVFLKSPSIAAFFPGDGSLPLMTAFFGLFMFSGIFGSACARTHKLNLFDHLAGNKMFTLIMCGVTAAQVAILYGGGAAFRVTPLSGRQFALVAALAFLTVPAHLIRKVIYKSTGVKMGT